MEELNQKFSKRLKHAMITKNIRQIDLSNMTGINKVKIHNYMNGKYLPKQDALYLLSKALDVTVGYLMGWDDEINKIKTEDKPIKIPVLGKISAGMPILATENIEGYEFAPSSFLKEDYQYFYLRVQGDSMNLKFQEKDLILIQKQNILENGEIGVILVDDEATVKKYRLEGNMVVLEPMSSNSEHHVQIYDVKKIKIIGKVILHIGKV